MVEAADNRQGENKRVDLTPRKRVRARMRDVIHTLLSAATLAAALQGPPVAPPPRDPVPRSVVRPDVGASIEGRVTDRTSGAAVARAIVRIRQADASAVSRATLTDADGGYRFDNLQPGRYIVTAESPENTATYLSQRFGQEQPIDPTRPATSKPIELKAAETRQADVALWRAVAIEGRVFGERGEPLANMRVSALVASSSTPGVPGTAWKTTDDRGAFRLFNLRPGEYRVCVEPGATGTPARDDPVSDSERRLRTCYPDALHEGDGQVIVLTSGDASGIDIRVQRGRTYSIMGFVLDSSGAPMVGGTVSLLRGEGSGTSQDIQLTEGRFLARGLPAGNYTIGAEIGGPSSYQDKREREVGLLDLRVESDLEGIVLQTAKGARITGRVEFDGNMPSGGVETLRISARPVPGTGIFFAGPADATAVDSNLTFRLEGLFGPHVLHISGAPQGWILKAIRHRGEDVFGLAREFKTSADPNDLVVVLTDKAARVTGRVTDVSGAPVAGSIVMLLPADPERRADFPGSVVGSAVGDDGTFRLPLVRAGEYAILAIDPDDLPRGTRSSAQVVLARLAEIAERIVLAEREQMTINLRLARPR